MKGIKYDIKRNPLTLSTKMYGEKGVQCRGKRLQTEAQTSALPRPPSLLKQCNQSSCLRCCWNHETREPFSTLQNSSEGVTNNCWTYLLFSLWATVVLYSCKENRPVTGKREPS